MCAVHASADTRAGNSQGEIKCESAARSSQSWRRGEEEARRFLSLKLSHSDLFYFLFKRKKNLSLVSFFLKCLLRSRIISLLGSSDPG